MAPAEDLAPEDGPVDVTELSAQDGDTEQLRLVIRQYREVLEGIISL